MTAKTLYRFGPGVSDGDASMKDLLGGKGANLAEMAKLGLPVPAGVTIPTTLCNEYQKLDDSERYILCGKLAAAAINEFKKLIENGSLDHMPLLSARSGARVSMPGMMDTILNVGITSKNLKEWAERLGDRAALDSYRRLIQMYGSTVKGIPHESFEHELAQIRFKTNAKTDADLTPKALEEVVKRYRAVYAESTNEAFPDTLQEQLAGCIGAVFGSWNNERAIEYRIANKIPHDWGTAVTVQSMVFGNMDEQSATGVLFTRDPNTGEPGLFGEFLVNAQGEDVVAGIRTPEPLVGIVKWNVGVYAKLKEYALFMEAHARDMQDMEFTVQSGKLFILQTRNGKRSAKAAFRIAYDLLKDKTITTAEAVKRVTGKQYMALKRPTIANGFNTAPTFKGLPAAGSVVTGIAVMTAADAKNCKEPCILVREETTPDDFGGMMAAVGILTRTGGATSHAAVVARGMDKCCVVGASDMKIGSTIKAGDKVTIDGQTGRVWVKVDVPVQAGGVTVEAQAIADLAKSQAAAGSAIRISLTPDQLEMQLPHSGQVVLSAFALLASNAGKNTRRLLEELDTRPQLTGVIDFTEVSGDIHADDTKLLGILGLKTVTAPKAKDVDPARILNKLQGTKWTKKLKSRWTLKCDAALASGAKACGWATAKKAVTLADLIAGGALEVTTVLQAKLADEGLTAQQLLELLKDAGRDVSLMPKAVDEDTLMFAVLGK